MPSHSAPTSSAQAPGNYWQLQDAKARFSELIRRAGERGPQHVTINGRDQAVVLSTADYLRLRGHPSGGLLVALMADSPLVDITMKHPKITGPVRDLEL